MGQYKQQGSSNNLLASETIELTTIPISISRPSSPEPPRDNRRFSKDEPEAVLSGNNEVLLWDQRLQRPASPNNNLRTMQIQVSPAKEFSENEVRSMLRTEMIWDNLLQDLQSLGQEVVYTDLLQLSIIRHPHDAILHLVGFMGILMGLKPSWSTMKGTLLKEYNIFMNFVRNVDPLDIPPRRVKKALRFVKEQNADFSIKVMQSVSSSAVNLSRYIFRIPIHLVLYTYSFFVRLLCSTVR